MTCACGAISVVEIMTVGLCCDICARRLIRDESIARDVRHQRHASSRPFSKDYQLKGLVGEYEFAKFSGLPLDIRPRPRGDGHVDFISRDGRTIDVKTANIPKWLFVESGKPTADIFVLAGYVPDHETAFLLGWVTASRVLAVAPVLSKFNVSNHQFPRTCLEPMETCPR